jgi:hypothetical protein
MAISIALAHVIAGKLQASKDPKKNRPHDLYRVWFGGRLVASFGVSRGSKKDKGQGHIPRQIHLTPHETQLFAQCDLTYEAWVEKMREKGIIPPEPSSAE